MRKLFMALIVALGFTGSVVAQDLPDFLSYKKSVLNNHSFVSYSGFNSPFINTKFTLNFGTGYTSVITIPPMDIGNVQTPAINGVLMFTGVNVGYQQRFTPWLSLYFNMKMFGRFGTNTFSLLYDGINTVSGGEIGWNIRIIESKKLFLSASFFVENLEGSFINLKEFLNDVINDVPDAAIIKNTPLLQTGAALQFAYAFNQTWGLQGETKFAYGETFTRGSEQVTFSGGFLGDVDFFPKHHFPLGIGLGYIISSFPEVAMDSDGIYSIAIGKLSYTGSSDFDLGVELMTYKLKLDNKTKDPFLTSLSLSFAFYF